METKEDTGFDYIFFQTMHPFYWTDGCFNYSVNVYPSRYTVPVKRLKACEYRDSETWKLNHEESRKNSSGDLIHAV